jgi:hypothetical protein
VADEASDGSAPAESTDETIGGTSTEAKGDEPATEEER